MQRCSHGAVRRLRSRGLDEGNAPHGRGYNICEIASRRGAALLIVLAMVVLLTGLAVAYLSRTTSDRQVAHASFHQSQVDGLAQSAMDLVIGDLQQEITNGSTAISEADGSTLYTPTAAANMDPQRRANAAGAPNLIRVSVRSDSPASPGVGSRASAVNSTTDLSANGRFVTSTRWNGHYLVPKGNTATPDSSPIQAFTNATPDWVFIAPDPNNPSQDPRKVITGPDQLVIGRYAYAIYDEGGLLDMNVVGYPTDPSTAPLPTQRFGRKGSVAFADLTALGNYPFFNPTSGPQPVYQVDRLVGWRNYATTNQSGTNNNNFPDSQPSNKAFARNFQSAGPAGNYYTYVVNNTNGFLSPNPTASPNGLTDQVFLGRSQLIAHQRIQNTNNGIPIANTSQFDVNALQYLSTFSMETNAPSFSPLLNASEMGGNDQGGIYTYRTNASSPTAVNPNFLLQRVTGNFTRFDSTAAVVGEPLVKTRFPLSRLAWITYKGPSASLAVTDPVYTALINAGVSTTTIQAGTAANIKACFGLTFGGNTGDPWTYTNPTGTSAASAIMRLDQVAAAGREPDFFELLQAGILSGSLGQNTGGGVTGGNVFPDIHMSSTTHHILSIGAAIIDQADPDSVPTRIQFSPDGVRAWTAYGIESLPYITQIYPITGASPADSTRWATYLLFQLWNPHIGATLSPAAPQVRIRVDGGIGMFTGGNGQTWATATDKQTMVANGGVNSVQNMPLTAGAFPPTLPTPTPVPLGTPGVASVPAVGSVPVTAQCGFERLPGNGANSLTNYVGLRLLPDYLLTPASSGNNPQLTLYFGTDATHQLNATMEYLAPGTTNTWVPYNHFIGINDSGSWIIGDTVPVRTASSLNGRPGSGDAFDNNAVNRLRDSPLPDCLMKADPRATRFGIFQFKQTLSSTTGRITDPLWPTGNANYPNGYGGPIADPAGPVQHAPLRFSGSPYFPATLCINNAASTATRTGYGDLDAVIRPADATYTEAPATGSSTGSTTPYYATTTSGSADYHPIVLNRPLRNVAELGYAFRDLPWKTLDFFSDKSADAGLLDIFCIHDGPPVLDGSGNTIGMAPPTMAAGKVNLNSTQAADLQSVFAGAILDEISSSTVNKTGTGATDAPVLAANIANATSTTAMQNKSELLTRAGLPTTILPVPPSGAAHDQRVKSRREVVARTASSVSQTRVWNLLIDVVAQSGRYKPNATSPQNDFIVEGEQHYWVHVAIDRFTGQVIDKQIEVVTE
jgi:hypothetical protein